MSVVKSCAANKASSIPRVMGSGSVGNNNWLINRECILMFDDQAN